MVVTPNAPVIVQQGGPQSVTQPLTAPGAAEMPPAPSAPVATNAPQNEAWSNVSHINGTPIKVGERGAYLYKFKKGSNGFAAMLVFIGLLDISATHALSQNVAISGAITHLGDMTQFSATMPIYLKRAYSGPFLEPGLLIRSEETHSYCYDCDGGYREETSSWGGPQLMLGWHWTFDSGLNLAAAFGFAKRFDSGDEYGENTEANGYFRVGYAF